MAIVNGQFRFLLLDEQGLKTSLNMPLNLSDALTIAAANTAWVAQGALLDAVTGAQITGGGVLLTQGTTGKTAPAADSRIQELGTLDFGNGATPYLYGSSIPAILDSVLTSNKQQIDEANTAMAAYIASITAAVLGGHFTNHAYQALTILVQSFLADRKHRRVLRNRSLRRP